MKQLRKISTDDPVVRQIQDNVQQVISPIVDKAILDGVYLKDVELTTGSIDIVGHKLGRQPLGYIVVKRNANSTIWDSATDKRTLSLNCSANVTISIWIF